MDALAAFHHAHPGVELVLVKDDSDRLVDRVRAGAADLAMIGSAVVPLPGPQALTILRGPVPQPSRSRTR